ncbi:gnk2-like domain-containing protein [Artemisia annua]|uniref:Gnk2-like domain-containing protein n=1 Tax=Artemisia annua TaxID=35608 RepID=A0A2U1LEQ1_ARTAN|nr:gnk2-like domain-containing protein [Artemisia annua]
MKLRRFINDRNGTHIPKNLVSSLLQELVEKSKTSKFYQTSTGDDTFAVSGIFQCRGDLANENCHDCILNTITKLSCASGGSLARVQLKGYFQHKKCGERRSWFEGLQEVRDAAFELVTKCVMSSHIGHCETTHEGMYGMGQCAGSLEECECGECVSNAFQVAQDECWGSDSGEVYLENCFINFRDNQPNHGGGRSFQEYLPAVYRSFDRQQQLSFISPLPRIDFEDHVLTRWVIDDQVSKFQMYGAFLGDTSKVADCGGELDYESSSKASMLLILQALSYVSALNVSMI